MTQAAYLTRLAVALPNEPVDNQMLEQRLGQVGGRPSRARALVLRSNGIRSRHYAIDAAGRPTHSNAQLSAEAVRGLVGDGFALDDIDLLACGTSSPDQLMPGHAPMVHGELGIGACEVSSSAGICIAGVNALKYAAMAVASGQATNAVVTASEVASSFMRAAHFQAENDARLQALETRPIIAFEKDFLRWMLSDGAAAALLRPQPAPDAPSLRIDWIDLFSYAGELPACMYAGADKREDGSLRGWREFASMHEVAAQSVMAVKQDVRLLDEGIRRATAKGTDAMLARRGLRAADVDWFLPHYSSLHFRPILQETLAGRLDIPEARWFTNLPEVGNVGSASFFLMLEALLASGQLRRGQRVLGYVPESGRFSVSFVHLTVV